MHIQTHVLSGWCIADLLNLTPRERLFAMAAASAADLDGLGIIVSLDCYVKYHHVLAHNLLFGVLLAGILALFSLNKAKGFWLFLALFHLHLVLDYWGSGPGWGIAYLWPFSQREVLNPYCWDLSSWQNFLAMGCLLAWSVQIAFKRRRTPFEIILPSLEQQLVQAFRRND